MLSEKIMGKGLNRAMRFSPFLYVGIVVPCPVLLEQGVDGFLVVGLLLLLLAGS